MVKLKRQHDDIILTLQPNRSANWQQTKIVILVMATFVMLIALAWSVVGAWVILPFAGLEVTLLAFLMYRVSYSTYQKQIISIQNQQVIFQAGVYYPKRYIQFNRDHLTIKTTSPDTVYDHTQVVFESPQQKVEVGAFLNQLDRELMLTHLKNAQLYIHNDKWWKSS